MNEKPDTPWLCVVQGSTVVGSMLLLAPQCVTSDMWRAEGHENCGFRTRPLGAIYNPWPIRPTWPPQ